MRKPLLKTLLYLALASVGYGAGLRMAPAPERTPATPQAALTGGPSTAPPRPADTPSATFAERLPRLRELSGTSSSPGWNHLSGLGTRPGQIEFELESIFALASREDLVAWFAEEDLAKTGAAVLNAAYARFAALSPDEAVSLWSDQLRRTGKRDGVDGLVRTWAGADPVAAERWVFQLADPKAKKDALFALLDTVVETAPDLVERHLAEVAGNDRYTYFRSVHLASRLARITPSERLAPLADRFLSETEGPWEYQSQLVALLEVWAERDGAAAMRWLLGQPRGRLKDHVIPGLVDARTKADPAAFLREIGPSLAGNEAYGEMAGQAWIKWLAGDKGEEALEWFQTHGADVRISEQGLWRSISTNSGDLNRVLSHLAMLPGGETKSLASRVVLHQLSQTDPKSALHHARDLLPPGQDADFFIASSLSNLARNGDPTGALAWAMEHLDAGQGRNDAVRFVMSSWAEANPAEAAEHAKNLPEALRKDAYSGIASHWAERSPEQLLAYLNKAADPAVVAPLAQHAFWSLGYDRGGEAYLSQAIAFPDEAMRRQAVEGLFGGWASADLESSARALDGMGKGPLRDVAIATFVSIARRTDREAAITWSFEIGDDQKRRNTVMDQGRRWLNADREAATRWIETSTALPAEWKAELLKPAP